MLAYRRDYAEEISSVFRSKLRNERQASRCTTFIIRKVLKLHFQSPSFEVKVEWGSDFYLDEFFFTNEILYLHFPLHTKRKKAGKSFSEEPLIDANIRFQFSLEISLPNLLLKW